MSFPVCFEIAVLLQIVEIVRTNALVLKAAETLVKKEIGALKCH